MGSGCGWAGALVYWLWEETHILKVVGSNPSPVYWMDIFHHFIISMQKIVMFEKTRINEKEAGYGFVRWLGHRKMICATAIPF